MQINFIPFLYTLLTKKQKKSMDDKKECVLKIATLLQTITFDEVPVLLVYVSSWFLL